MKKLIYILLAGCAMACFSSCSDDLETQPTDKVSGTQIFADAKNAETAINGIYRMTYTSGWGSDWNHMHEAQTSIALCGSLMSEDMVLVNTGNGWYMHDYQFAVHGHYTTKAGREYATWNYFYTMIGNCNYIIAQENTIGGDPDLKDEVVGQAYAMRGFAYFNLIQSFQQTYKGNEDKPGVPVYTEPTVAGTPGKGRGTVQDVYTQIDSDLNKAIELLGKKKNQSHKSHVDYYVTQGFKARVAMVKNQWEEAIEAAKEAMKQPNLQVTDVKTIGGMNSVTCPDVMWGVEVVADQTTGWAGFFSHMDADGQKYAAKAQKAISSWLYGQIPATDARKGWWRGVVEGDNAEGSNVSYCQLKFKYKDAATGLGDYVYMRAEEMVLIKAEAECHAAQYGAARATLTELGSKRDSEFNKLLEKVGDANTYNENPNSPIATLMDLILLQRRIELWGECSRIFDLQRLKLGVYRDFEGSNHTTKGTTLNLKAGSPLFIYPLPQSEIDGNENISASDNNEIVMK